MRDPALLCRVERIVEGCRGAGPCQALAAEGGGRKARLYKGQASPATIATSGPMGCDSRPRARAKPLAGRYITHSFFKRGLIRNPTIKSREPATGVNADLKSRIPKSEIESRSDEGKTQTSDHHGDVVKNAFE